MPPKKNASSTKAENKAKAKIIEDKTFGLKNKNKSSKVNKYIQQVEQQVKSSGNQKKMREAEDAKAALREKKKAEEARKAELAALFKPVVQQQKVPPGVDPKTVLCAAFKAGSCAKGDKCKFSHDLGVERRVAKLDIYADRRQDGSSEDGVDGDANAEDRDTMQDWDQNKLEQVVQRRHGGKGKQPATDIVCKYFLDAIEKKNYGWFWECPNGGDSCKYRHALPPGFVLKSQQSKAAAAGEDGEEMSLEEFLETERYRIEKKTPVTEESFAKWKADRKAKALAEEAARERDKEQQIRAGKMLHVSGRDLFTYNADLFHDDEEAMDVDYTLRDDHDEEEDDVEGDNEVDVVAPVDETLFLEASLEDLDIE